MKQLIGTTEIYFTKFSFNIKLDDFLIKMLIKLINFRQMQGGVSVEIDDDGNIILEALKEKNYKILRELFLHGFRTNQNIINIMRMKYQAIGFVIRVQIPNKKYNSTENHNIYLLDGEKLLFVETKNLRPNIIDNKDKVENQDLTSNLKGLKLTIEEQHIQINRRTRARRKAVLQYTKDGEFITKYESAFQAAKKTFIHQGNISSCCRKERKLAGNYFWRYKLVIK